MKILLSKKRVLITILSLSLFILLVVGMYYSEKKKEVTLSYNEFIEELQNNHVEKVVLGTNEYMKVNIKDSSIKYIVPNPRKENFKEFLLTNNIEVSEADSGETIQVLQGILFIGVILTAYFFASRRFGGKNSSNGMKLDYSLKSDSTVTFNDIAGNEEAKESVLDIIEFIKNPEKFVKYGARMPRGIIFYGPPGTGKTLMAKAIAGEASVPFYSVSGSDFVQLYVGVGASRVRDLFKKAREHHKAVIFIDEIDALGKKRSNSLSSNDERDQTLNALLTEMSGFNDNDGIVVIAATNRLDILDSALLRPGRFDRQVEIGYPDVNAREYILRLHCRNKPLSDEVDLKDIAKQTVYFTGAMLENLLNEAAIFAAKENNKFIDSNHIDKAYYTIIAGAEKKDKSVINEKDRIITAYHEAGHALVTKLMAPENTVSKVTIIPSTKGAGGFSTNITPDKMFYTKVDMEVNIMISLAGRASEEIIFGIDKITTGASNDIEKATVLIKDYISKYGMSNNIGLINLHIINSDSIQNNLMNEYKVLMKELYNQTKNSIIENKYYLNKIATALLEKETLREEDLNTILLDKESGKENKHKDLKTQNEVEVTDVLAY